MPTASLAQSTLLKVIAPATDAIFFFLLMNLFLINLNISNCRSLQMFVCFYESLHLLKPFEDDQLLNAMTAFPGHGQHMAKIEICSFNQNINYTIRQSL